MKKKIYAVLLLTAVCAGSGVFAQSSAPKENLEKYYTLERIQFEKRMARFGQCGGPDAQSGIALHCGSEL